MANSILDRTAVLNGVSDINGAGIDYTGDL
jgi:hypothetical protein